jgi:hypothetical protein
MAGDGIRPATAAPTPDADPLPCLRVGRVLSPVLWAAPGAVPVGHTGVAQVGHVGTMAVGCTPLCHWAASGFGLLAFDLFLYFLIIFKSL